MARYRKKPIVIDAVHWTEGQGDGPDWLREAFATEVVFFSDPPSSGFPPAYIKTLEGVMRVDAGDWIIRGIKGEIYPCKDEIFVATYDPV